MAHYLTTEFYSLNYTLRQRLDILEVKREVIVVICVMVFDHCYISCNYGLYYLISQVLALAAQELSKPVTERKAATISSATTAESTPYPGDNPVHWQQVVEKRIQSKTKRLTKVLPVSLVIWNLSASSL